jgi:hypothetical protein
LFSEPDAAAANTLTIHTPDGKKGLTFNNCKVFANPVSTVSPVDNDDTRFCCPKPLVVSANC